MAKSNTLKSKSKCLLLSVAVFLVIAVTLFTSIAPTASTNGNVGSTVSTGTSADVIQTKALAATYVKNTYGSGKSNFKIGAPTEKFVSSINLSQTTMNRAYNAAHYTQYNGTCSEVAITILANMYANDNKVNLAEIIPTFDSVLTYAIAKGYYKNGTYASDLDLLLDYALDLNTKTKSKDAVDDYWDVYADLKSNANSGKLTLFNISGHSMVGAGYIEYPISWTEARYLLFWKIGTKTVTDTIKFAIVNDGWSDATAATSSQDGVYSYFPASKIGSDFLASLFCYSAYLNVLVK
jgi:hypothetical protein